MENYWKSFSLYSPIYISKKRQEINLNYQSKALIGYKHKILKLPLGKKDNITIPKVLLSSDYKVDFLRGLFDTDGGLTFKKRNKKINYYPVLDISSKSSRLVIQVNKLLRNMQFTTSVVLDQWSRDSKGNLCKGSRVFLYGKENLIKWMENIGTSNPAKRLKFDLWKKQGYLPQDWRKALGGI